MIYTILGSFCSFLNWEGPIFRPKSGLGKSLPFQFLIYTMGHPEFIVLNKKEDPLAHKGLKSGFTPLLSLQKSLKLANTSSQSRKILEVDVAY